jgi:uncharacterized protein (DUF697 family)
LATHIVDRFALWAGVAGLIPLPGVDIVTVAGVQLQMLRRLSQLYGVAFSENRGKALLASVAGSTIPASSAFGTASALKIVPFLGSITSGFVMPILSAGATYGIGKAFVQHFESGGTLLDFHAPDYRAFISAQKAKWVSRFRRGDRATAASASANAHGGTSATAS